MTRCSLERAQRGQMPGEITNFSPTRRAAVQSWHVFTMPNLGGEHGQTRMNPTLHGAALEHSALVHETAALTEETAELRSLSSACGSALGYHPPPEHYQIGLVIATIGLLVTMGLHRRAVRILRARTAFSSKRVLYRMPHEA